MEMMSRLRILTFEKKLKYKMKITFYVSFNLYENLSILWKNLITKYLMYTERTMLLIYLKI